MELAVYSVGFKVRGSGFIV